MTFLPKYRLSGGSGLAVELRKIRIPRDASIAARCAIEADRSADEAFELGDFAAADRLAHLYIELTARAEGRRA